VGERPIKLRPQRRFAYCKKPANGGLLSDIVEEISRDRTGWLAQQCRWPRSYGAKRQVLVSTMHCVAVDWLIDSLCLFVTSETSLLR
jgi:hypothetical protein